MAGAPGPWELSKSRCLYRRSTSPLAPFLLGAAHPIRAGARQRLGEQASGATWLAPPDRELRTKPEPTFPTLADPGQPGASYRRRQQHNPWGGSCPLTRRHTPGGRLRGGGSASQRLRLLKAERQWSNSAQRSAACGSFQSRTPCKRIGCVQRQSHVPGRGGIKCRKPSSRPAARVRAGSKSGIRKASPGLREGSWLVG